MAGSSIPSARSAATECASVRPAGTIRDPLVPYAVPAASASAGVAAARAIGHVASSGTTAITHSTLLTVRYSGALLPISCTKISTALLPADVLPRIVLAIRQAIPTSRAAVLISQ